MNRLGEWRLWYEQDALVREAQRVTQSMLIDFTREYWAECGDSPEAIEAEVAAIERGTTTLRVTEDFLRWLGPEKVQGLAP